jgi:hypothetical protein
MLSQWLGFPGRESSGVCHPGNNRKRKHLSRPYCPTMFLMDIAVDSHHRQNIVEIATIDDR